MPVRLLTTRRRCSYGTSYHTQHPACKARCALFWPDLRAARRPALEHLGSPRGGGSARATAVGLLLAALHVNAQEVVRHLRLREDGARLAQEVFGLGLVAGEVARAEVREHETARARFLRRARPSRRSSACCAREPFVGFGEGRLVYEEVCAAREFDGRAAVGRVRAVDDAPPLQVGPQEVRAVERASVGSVTRSPRLSRP
jgi:hypothetical protein